MIQVADAAVIVNNEVVPTIPNTVKFTEGLGEQSMRSVSIGEGKTEQVWSNNVESSIGMVAFEIPVTVELIELARTWKGNQNQNLVQLAGRTADGKELTRTFSGAALLSDYEVELGSDTTITVEFKGNVAI